MKQKIGVCIFSAIIVLGAAVTIRIVGEKNIPPEELEIDTEENTQNSEEIPVQVAVDTQEETVTTNKELIRPMAFISSGGRRRKTGSSSIPWSRPCPG